MKHLKQIKNQKLYTLTAFVATVLMVIGALFFNPRSGGADPGYIFHCALVVLLSVCLFIYPKHRSHMFRVSMVTIASIYLYMLFFFYPETWSTFTLLCFIPAFSIMFFDSKLFYFSFVFNFLMITCTFIYIIFFDQGHVFAHLKLDVFGNINNFIGTQVILYFIFHLTSHRIKKQQVYYERLQQSEKLKTTGQLAAAVAHEIRNPLTVVKGLLQFYETNNSFSQTGKSHLSLMIDELKTAEHVLTQFLSIAKPDEDQQMETVNVREALQSVTGLLMSYGLYHQNKIDLQIDEDLYITANTIEFKQLFMNLVKNAIEVSTNEDFVVIRAYQQDEEIIIKVIDEGMGMSAEQVQALGTPFYSLKTKGTGLGLMICFNIVEKYKGTIRFQSAVNQGTTVTVRFPMCALGEIVQKQEVLV